jgi:hypothetical protein
MMLEIFFRIYKMVGHFDFGHFMLSNPGIVKRASQFEVVFNNEADEADRCCETALSGF